MKIVFHVGMPKTGTSTLQAFFFDNRKLLHNQGIYYPIKPISNYFEGQQVLLHPHISGSLEKSNECLAQFIQEGVDSKCDILLLSMEATQEFINFFDFKNFSVEIIQYIRIFPSFNESLFSQCLKTPYFNGIRGLNNTRLASFSKNELVWIKDIQKKYTIYNYSYEKIAATGIIKHFCSLLGISTIDNFILPESSNISFPTSSLFFIAHCNILPLPNHIRMEILHYLEKNQVCSDAKKYLLVPPEMYRAWIEEEKEKLQELGELIHIPDWVQKNLDWLEGKVNVPYKNLPAHLQHEIFHNLPQHLQDAIIEVWPYAQQASPGSALLPSLPESLERQDNYFYWFKALLDLQMKEATFLELQQTVTQQKQQISQLLQENNAFRDSLFWRSSAWLRRLISHSI